MQNNSFNINNDYINIKQSTIITLNEYFQLVTEEGALDIKTTIQCDFADIPEKYQEVVLNILTSKYINKVSFGNNPFSQCKPVVKKKWWEFWRAKFFQLK